MMNVAHSSATLSRITLKLHFSSAKVYFSSVKLSHINATVARISATVARIKVKLAHISPQVLLSRVRGLHPEQISIERQWRGMTIHHRRHRESTEGAQSKA
jgi:hypothetical protein